VKIKFFKKSPKISVVLPSYNHGKFIAKAIESVLDQSFGDIELIIIDDLSNDESWEVIKKFNDKRIISIQNDRHSYASMGVNEAIANIATGKYIAIHNSDDIWKQDKLAIQYNFLQNNLNIGAVFTDVNFIDGDELPLEISMLKKAPNFSNINRNRHEWILYLIKNGNTFCHPSALIRKSCFKKVGLYKNNLLQLPDFDMWMRILMHFDIHVINQKLVNYRILKDMTNTSSPMQRNDIRVANEFYNVFANLKSITSFKALCKIFPALEKYKYVKNNDINFLMAISILELRPHIFAQHFALDLLSEVMGDDERREYICKNYNFSLSDLFALTGEINVYNL
jgi:glycosyltransferase involved in cell wall biosynthesis